MSEGFGGMGEPGPAQSGPGGSGAGEPALPDSGLGPMGDVHLLAAALRMDRADVASYTRLLADTLGGALPPGMVEIERRRSVGDRLAGRPGEPVGVRVHTPERQLELRQGRHGAVEAEVQHVVRDVVISRRPVGIDEWLATLASELIALARGDAAARAALSRLLGG